MINEKRYFMIISMPLKSLQASENKGHMMKCQMCIKAIEVHYKICIDLVNLLHSPFLLYYILHDLIKYVPVLLLCQRCFLKS